MAGEMIALVLLCSLATYADCDWTNAQQVIRVPETHDLPLICLKRAQETAAGLDPPGPGLRYKFQCVPEKALRRKDNRA